MRPRRPAGGGINVNNVTQAKLEALPGVGPIRRHFERPERAASQPAEGLPAVS